MILRRGIFRAAVAVVTLGTAISFSAHVKADPLATAGIGLQICSKLTSGMKPEEGLNNQLNYLVYYWVQGYMSAANITTLESDGEYIDLSLNDEKKIIPLVFDFCTRNPDKKPITVIDDLLGSAEKIKGEWVKGSIPWAAE